MADDLSERYGDLLTESYDCVDRIVLNAYYPMGHGPGGFRVWWRFMLMAVPKNTLHADSATGQEIHLQHLAVKLNHTAWERRACGYRQQRIPYLRLGVDTGRRRGPPNT